MAGMSVRKFDYNQLGGITSFVPGSDEAVVGSASPVGSEDGAGLGYEVEYEVEFEIESEDGLAALKLDLTNPLSEMGHMTGLWVQNHRFQSYLI